MTKHVANPSTANTFPIGNGFAPRLSQGGPRCVVVALDFTTDGEIDVDFTTIQQAGALSFLQSVFVDNSANAAALKLVFDQTGQLINIPALSQGVYPVIAPVSTKLTATTTPGAGILCTLIGLNVPMPLTQWGPITVTANVSSAPLAAIAADHSSTMAVAGTSQPLFGANAAAKRRTISNPSTNAESLFINFGGIAAGPTNSTEIMPGGSYDSGGGPIDQTAWTINNTAQAAQPYVAKEYV